MNLIFKGKSGQFYITSNNPIIASEMTENFNKNYQDIEIDGISFKMDKDDNFENNGMSIYINYENNSYKLVGRGIDNLPVINYNRTGVQDTFSRWFDN